MLKYLILTVLPFFFFTYKFADTDFKSNFIQNKINYSLDNNFSYSSKCFLILIMKIQIISSITK